MTESKDADSMESKMLATTERNDRAGQAEKETAGTETAGEHRVPTTKDASKKQWRFE